VLATSGELRIGWSEARLKKGPLMTSSYSANRDKVIRPFDQAWERYMRATQGSWDCGIALYLCSYCRGPFWKQVMCILQLLLGTPLKPEYLHIALYCVTCNCIV